LVRSRLRASSRRTIPGGTYPAPPERLSFPWCRRSCAALERSNSRNQAAAAARSLNAVQLTPDIQNGRPTFTRCSAWVNRQLQVRIVSLALPVNKPMLNEPRRCCRVVQSSMAADCSQGILRRLVYLWPNWWRWTGRQSDTLCSDWTRSVGACCSEKKKRSVEVRRCHSNGPVHSTGGR